ncbi:MAG: hypothetical protein HIU84_01395, partial [Acidobacteria bacterium]|nr:hypothetical protein [Acidobacteriota bacterium]
MNPIIKNTGALRSRITAVALTATVASLSLLTTSGAAAQHPTLVVYSAQGYDSAAVTAFNKTNPGFTVT